MKMRSLLLMALILAGTAAAVRAQTPFFAVSQDDFYPVITNAADLERPLIDGILRKTDDSVLTLRNPHPTRRVQRAGGQHKPLLHQRLLSPRPTRRTPPKGVLLGGR
jgi:hypothetical protein